jgi:tetratricopeptide (TPR) repeat protein
LVAGLLLGAGTLPAHAQSAPSPARPEALSADDSEALHTGMLEVRQLERSGDRAGAIRRGEELLKQFPANRRVEDVLISLYRLDRRDEPMMALLRARCSRDPDDMDSVRDLASLLLARGETNDAQRALEKFVAANPRDEARYRMSAGLLASRDQQDAAIQIYRQGRQAIGAESLFAAELAQLEADRGDYGAAIAEYLLLAADPDRRARVWREISALLDRAEDSEKVLQRIEEMRRSHPRSAPIQDVAAMAALQMGHYPEALNAVRDADKWAGDRGELLLDFGRAALAGEPDSLPPARVRAGIEALQLLPERHPDSNLIPDATRMGAEGMVAVARALPEGGERTNLLRQAVAFIDANVPRMSPPQAAEPSLALKGLILFEDLGQPEAALGVFQSVADAQKRRGEPDQLLRVQMALCHAALGHLDQARAALETLVASDSTEADNPFENKAPSERAAARRLVARPLLPGEMDLIGGQYDKARDGFAALAEQAPEDRLANDCLDLALTLNESAGDDQKGAAALRCVPAGAAPARSQGGAQRARDAGAREPAVRARAGGALRSRRVARRDTRIRAGPPTLRSGLHGASEASAGGARPRSER